MTRKRLMNKRRGQQYRERLIINGNASLIAGTSAAVTVFTATVPCRFVHKQTRGNIIASGAGTPSIYGCALVKVPQGYTANSIVQTAATPMYQPEENVLAYVSGILAGGTNLEPCVADTLRGGSCFLQVGDTIQYVQISSTAPATSYWTVDFTVSS